MAGPVQLGAAWILALVTLGVIVMGAAVWYLWFPKGLRDWMTGVREAPWPRQNEGGGWEHEDGRITRDREGREEIQR